MSKHYSYDPKTLEILRSAAGRKYTVIQVANDQEHAMRLVERLNRHEPTMRLIDKHAPPTQDQIRDYNNLRIEKLTVESDYFTGPRRGQQIQPVGPYRGGRA